MPKSLITGGAGFIGSHVVKHCLALGHEVVVLDDLSGGFEDHIPEGALFVQGSVVDHELVTELFEEHRFDYVYHLAAYAAEGFPIFTPRFNFKNTLSEATNLITERSSIKAKVFSLTPTFPYFVRG